jgi:hypothetical protein
LKKPFQEVGKIFIEKVKKTFQATGELTQEYQLNFVILKGWKNKRSFSSTLSIALPQAEKVHHDDGN